MSVAVFKTIRVVYIHFACFLVVLIPCIPKHARKGTYLKYTFHMRAHLAKNIICLMRYTWFTHGTRTVTATQKKKCMYVYRIRTFAQSLHYVVRYTFLAAVYVVTQHVHTGSSIIKKSRFV